MEHEASAQAPAVSAASWGAGIVQGTAEVVALRRKTDFSSLDISFPAGAADGVQLGASIAINGTCLTVRHFFDF